MIATQRRNPRRMTVAIQLMKPHPPVSLAIALLAFVTLPACRKPPEPPPPVVVVRKELPENLLRNNLDGLPGSVHTLGAASPIHWQPWTRETLQYARAAERMIFAMVVMPQANGFEESLEAIGTDPAIVEILNTSYMPVLIDGDAAREIALLTADLSMEIDKNVNMPFFLWMSPDANPVGFIPAPWTTAASLRETFRSSHVLIWEIWKDSPQYVVDNSALDNEPRRARIDRRRLSNIGSKDPAGDTARALRQLSSLYDPFTRTLHEVGGLFPTGAVDLLAASVMQPGLPVEVRDHSAETLGMVLEDLMGSPMFDPLDGGMFSARRGNSWLLPSFQRNSVAQSRAAVALFRAHQATGNALALERALGLLAFCEANYRTEEGMFAIGLNPSHDPQHWLWSIEDVEQILGPDEAKWWVEYTGMKPLGNIPYELDPKRAFFRRNSLANKQTTAEFAATLGISESAFRRKLDSARMRLLAAREERVGKTPSDGNAHAGASFRMVSAYAAAYTATGDEAWRDKAVELLTRCRESFSSGVRLKIFIGDAPESIGAARAFHYALAIQAVLDVIDITGKAEWFHWCDDLATVMAELFTDGNFLKEASTESTIIDLPATDLIMLFDDSSVGLLNFAECRLAAQGRPMVRDLVELAGTLPASAVRFPVQHTDLLSAFLSRTRPVTVVWNEATSPELLTAVRRLPLRMIHRREATSADPLPTGGVLLIAGDGKTLPLTTADELANAILRERADP
jgi:uncharacterized protein YyaL (SSP411 family)